MIVQPIVSGGGSSSGNDLMKEVDWAEFSNAFSNQRPPKFNTGMIFLQNSNLYNGGIPIVLRADINAIYPNTNYMVQAVNKSYSISYSGYSGSFYAEVNDGSNNVMAIDYNIDDYSPPPTFADGWSARYFILDL